MFRNYKLLPSVWHETELDFEWNPETGEVRGRDAGRVTVLARQAADEGSVVGHPYPTSYEIKDPLHRPNEMAVVLGQFWKLPVDLALAYPKPEEDDLIYQIDSNGVEHVAEFQPIE